MEWPARSGSPPKRTTTRGWRRLSSMPADHPIFGRDVPDAAWRPTPELLRDSRLARFLLATGEPWADWWIGGGFNHAFASVEPRAAADPDGEAIAWEGEDGEVRRLSNTELRDAVDSAARMLRAQGFGQGDRVGIF